MSSSKSNVPTNRIDERRAVISNDEPDSLISAIRDGSLPRVEQLITALGPVNSLSWSDAYAPLYVAIENGHTEIAKLILVNLKTEDHNHEGAPMYDERELTNIVNIVQSTFVLFSFVGVTKILTTDAQRTSQIIAMTACLGDPGILQMLLDRHDHHDIYAKLLLHLAVRKDKMAIVELLLKRGADPNFNWGGRLPLLTAVDMNRLEIAECLIANGARLEASCPVDGFTRTALQLAIEKSNNSLVKLLLGRGASVEAPDKDQPSALAMAYDKAHVLTIAYAYVCTMDLRLIARKTRRIDLLDAVDHFHDAYTTIFQRLCMNYSADEFDNRQSMLPILVHAAAQSGFHEVIDQFLAFGYEINNQTVHELRNMEQQTLLHTAANHHQLSTVEFLIKKGSAINALSSVQKSSIFYAISNADVTITRLLIDNGARLINAPLLLRIAVNSASSQIVDMILQHEPLVDVNAKDKRGNTMLHTVSAGSRNESFNGNERVKIIKTLLARGADVDARGLNGASPLHFAVQEGRIEVVEVLLDHGADVNHMATSISDVTPLHVCAQNATSGDSSCVAIAKMLLARGATLDARTGLGETALHHASVRGNADLVEVLLNHGADVDARSPNGQTPLHYASLRGLVDTIDILVRFGSDINVTCSLGKTAPVCVVDRFVDVERRCAKHCRCRKLVRIFKEQVVRMTTAGLHVRKENIEALGRRRCRVAAFEEKCRREVVRMKKEKVSGNASFYDVLIKDVHEVAIYAKYENVVRTMESLTWRDKFPIYGDMIWNNFRRGRKREALLNASVGSFNLLVTYELIDVLTMEIFRYLSDEDLKNLIEARQPEGSSGGESTSYVKFFSIKILKNFVGWTKKLALKTIASLN